MAGPLLNPMGIGGTWQGNYQQPNVAAPVNNPAVGVALPPPPVVVSAAAPYVQPSTAPPASNPQVAVVGNLDLNTLDVEGVEPFVQPGQFPNFSAAVPAGVKPPALVGEPYLPG